VKPNISADRDNSVGARGREAGTCTQSDITDLHFHIRSWNAAAERLYGWRADEVRGRHVLDVLHWVDDSEQIPQMWEHLEDTGRWHGESTQLARDGSLVEVLSSTTRRASRSLDRAGRLSVNVSTRQLADPEMVERFSVARMQLERLLPCLVEDARQAVDLLRQRERRDRAERMATPGDRQKR